MRSLILSAAFLSAAFMLACQEQASSPVGPEGLGPQFHTGHDGDCLTHNKKDEGCPDGGDGGGDGTKVTWSEANLEVHGVPDDASTLRSTCSGSPAPKTTNPTVFWNDDEDPKIDGCVTVTTGGVTLTNDAHLIVGTKKGSTKFTIQFQIQNEGGFDSTQYRTDKFVVENDHLIANDHNRPFTGALFTLHVHNTVIIYKLKGHTGGPKDVSVGYIHIGDIVYR